MEGQTGRGERLLYSIGHVECLLVSWFICPFPPAVLDCDGSPFSSRSGFGCRRISQFKSKERLQLDFGFLSPISTGTTDLVLVRVASEADSAVFTAGTQVNAQKELV